MTQREKVLATTLVGILVVFGGGFVFHLFVYKPLSDVRQRRETLSQQLEQKRTTLLAEQKKIEASHRLNPRVKLWKELSVPPRDPAMNKRFDVSPEDKKANHRTEMERQYANHLRNLLLEAGFNARTKTVDVKAKSSQGGTAKQAKGKEPPFERLVFTVNEAQGTLDSLQKAMKALHATPLLHTVRHLSVTEASAKSRERLAPGTVTVNMTVEAIMLKDGEQRSTLLPYKLPFTPTVLAQPGRDYALMHRQNMFAGVDPLPPSSRASEDPREVLPFVRLTTIWWDPKEKRWEATLYDQTKGGPEIKVYAEGWRATFRVRDRHKNTLLEGRVMRIIDETELIFQADGKFYRMRRGDFMDEALKNEVEKKELVSLGIVPDA